MCVSRSRMVIGRLAGTIVTPRSSGTATVVFANAGMKRLDRIVEADLALFDERQHADAGDRLGLRGDAEDRVGRHPAIGFLVAPSDRLLVYRLAVRSTSATAPASRFSSTYRCSSLSMRPSRSTEKPRRNGSDREEDAEGQPRADCPDVAGDVEGRGLRKQRGGPEQHRRQNGEQSFHFEPLEPTRPWMTNRMTSFRADESAMVARSLQRRNTFYVLRSPSPAKADSTSSWRCWLSLR